jgi:hypothetical protein
MRVHLSLPVFLIVAPLVFALAAPGKAADPLGSAQGATPQGALARMPVREATIFKDGHAFMLHQGKMPTDASGNVVLDYLPTPVLGTFWPFSADDQVKLQAVLAGQRKVLIERTALNLHDLIRANIGANVLVTEVPAGREDKPLSYPATIISVPSSSGEELEETGPPGAGPQLPVQGNVVLLKTAEGLKVLDFSRIQDVTFRDEPARPKLGTEEFRNLLTLQLDWGGRTPPAQAEVGLMYLQRGLRWIPQYKITTDGKGNAAVEFQATLVNEMVDLEDVTCHLVIGVPSFSFKDQVDPISLQQALVQVAQQPSMDAGYLSNSIMTQAAGRLRREGAGSTGMADEQTSRDLGPEVSAAGQNEDLYVFTVKHVTLKKGQRMVLPVDQFTLPYEDIYTLDLPFEPPPEIRAGVSSDQQREIAHLLAAPKVMHKLRLTNTAKSPLTTAPVLIFRDGRPLAQGLMTYTSAGGKVDLEITTAVDLKATRTDEETGRVPNAVLWRGDEYGKVDLSGKISLTSFRPEAAQVEVTRGVLGIVSQADHQGRIEMLNVLDQDSSAEPYWWRWYSWPGWWYHFNARGRISWNISLEPGKTIDLHYAWNYYWR